MPKSVTTTSDRCPETHNPGVWPYTSRCVHPAGHDPSVEHRDRHGNTWPVRVTMGNYLQQGEHAVEMMRDAVNRMPDPLPPGVTLEDS